MYDSAQFQDVSFWSRWLLSNKCEQTWEAVQLSPLQKLLIVRALRPDRLLSALHAFACQILKLESLNPSLLDYQTLLQNISPQEPILFVTSTGTDPSQDLRDFAKQQKNQTFIQMSMGQGQGEKAIQALQEALEKGTWLYLQNLHLVMPWVSLLEKELNNLSEKAAHPNFRLFLSSEAHVLFPSTLLKNSYKLTTESPPGLKKSLDRIYNSWPDTLTESGDVLLSQSLFCLAWFHSILQERRLFLPQGWTKFYEFSNTDLRSSAELMQNLNQQKRLQQWSVLQGLFENAIYGSRMDNREDLSKLHVYCQSIFNDSILGTYNGQKKLKKLTKNIELPLVAQKQAFLNLIELLPEFNDFSLLGLPANTEGVLQQTISTQTLHSLRTLSRNEQNTMTKAHPWLESVPVWLQFWKKSNQNFTLEMVNNSTTSDDPVVSFIQMELLFASRILSLLNIQFLELEKVLEGSLLMTNDLLGVAQSLWKEETPTR